MRNKIIGNSSSSREDHREIKRYYRCVHSSIVVAYILPFILSFMLNFFVRYLRRVSYVSISWPKLFTKIFVGIKFKFTTPST